MPRVNAFCAENMTTTIGTAKSVQAAMTSCHGMTDMVLRKYWRPMDSVCIFGSVR